MPYPNEMERYLSPSGHTRYRIRLRCSECGTARYVDVRNLARMKSDLCGKCARLRPRIQMPTRTVDDRGYAKLYFPKGHSLSAMRDARGQIYEHRVIMARKLGRVLDPSEHVHHLNSDKTDNRPENLRLLDPHEHGSIHAKEYGFGSERRKERSNAPTQ